MYIDMTENISLSQFVAERSQQETVAGRLLCNCSEEARALVWQYVAVIDKEFPSTMNNNEQLMLACFILLAEGQELPV